MSTTVEASIAATIVQLAAAGFSVDVIYAGLERRRAARCSITRKDGTRIAFEAGASLLGTVVAAFEAAMNDREFATTTLDVVPVTTDAMELWHEIAAVASSYEFFSVRPVGEAFAIELACNGATTTWDEGLDLDAVQALHIAADEADDDQQDLETRLDAALRDA